MNRFLRVLLTIVMGVTWQQATADDRSNVIPLEEYQAFISTIKADIERKLELEFGDDEAELKELSTPFVIGEKITIRYWRGNNVETHTGTLVEVRDRDRPPSARIGDRKIPWGDIYGTDQERLKFANVTNKAALEMKLQRQRDALENRKDRVREIEMKKRLVDTIYGGDFESEYIAFGDYYRRRTTMGEKSIDLSLLFDDASPLVMCGLRNRSGQSSIVTVYYDLKPIATNLPPDLGVEVPNLDWKSKVFWMKRDSFGMGDSGAVASNLGKRFLVHVLQHGVGSWFVVSNESPAMAPRRGRSKRVSCPECMGTGRVRGKPGDQPAAPARQPDLPVENTGTDEIQLPDLGGGEDEATTTNTPSANLLTALESVTEDLAESGLNSTSGLTAAPMVACKGCDGKGQFNDTVTHNQVRVVYQFNLVEKGLNPYSAEIVNTFITSSRKTDAYQKEVSAIVTKVKDAARKKRIELASQAPVEPVAAAVTSVTTSSLDEPPATLETAYTWATAAVLRSAANPALLVKNYRGPFRYDDVDFPRTMSSADGVIYKVQRMTRWQETAKAFQIHNNKPRYSLNGLRWRALISHREDTGDMHYFIQYAVDVDTTNLFEQIKLKISASSQLMNKKVIASEDNPSFLPTRMTTFVGIQPVDPNDLASGMMDIDLKARYIK